MEPITNDIHSLIQAESKMYADMHAQQQTKRDEHIFTKLDSIEAYMMKMSNGRVHTVISYGLHIIEIVMILMILDIIL